MPKVILPTLPLQLTFFPPGSARFPPGSAGFRRVPPGSITFPQVPPGSTGFRRVPPPRRVPLGSTGLQAFARSVPPGSAGFPSRLPFQFIGVRFLMVLARRLSRLRQSKKRFCHCPGIVQVGLWKKSPIRWLSRWSNKSFLLGPHAEGDAILIFIVQLFHIETCQRVPTFIDFCIEHICQ